MQKFIFSTLKITILIVLATTYSYSEQGYDGDKAKLIPGTEKPTTKNCEEGGTAYIYDDYVIYTEASGDFDGANVYIYAPTSGEQDPCKMDRKQAHYWIGVGEYGGVNKFVGKYGNLLFLDQWTGRNFKRLVAINIETKSLVFLDTYTKPEIKDGKLNYFKTLKSKRESVREKIPCPDASKWEAQGKQVLYVEKMSTDLDTMKKTASNEFSCMPTDPIGTTKPRSYGH